MKKLPIQIVFLLIFTTIIICFIRCEEEGEINTPSDSAINDKIYLPDSNFEKRLIELGYDDVLDNYVLTKKIKDISTLDLRRLEINDLSGIEHFKSLTILKCDHNQISSLNLSQNSLLSTLDCDYNEIASLDLTGNTALVHLECDNNNLTSLNLKNNTKLKILGCNQNQLKSLNISQNTDLEKLNCNSNQITNFDASNNALLSSLNLTNNALNCVIVNQIQLEQLETNNLDWKKDDSAIYSLDCD